MATIDFDQPRSRRALIAAAAGSITAAVAGVMGHTTPAIGLNGDTIKVGGSYSGTLQTSIRNTSNDQSVFGGESSAGGTGIVGKTLYGRGVAAVADSANGTALFANSAGYALDAYRGRILVREVSGVATIPAGSTSKTVVLGVDVNDKTFVLLTPMANIGSRALWFTKDADADSFRIRMSSARSARTPVAWLALERI